MNKNLSNSNIFTKLAFEQAKINLGSTGTNPSVGCVVVKNGSVISSGYTSSKGRPHAEFNALKKKINFKDAFMYITLEPCSHYGETPPCTNIIIKKKIKKVSFSTFDFDRRSSEKSINVLKKKKIKVVSNIFNNHGLDFYKSYSLLHKKKLPLIDAKIAISKDYLTKNTKSKWITNIYSRNRVHYLRSNYDSILSSSKTINEDNSLLNCRIEGLEHKSPTIIIIDRDFKLNKNINILKNNFKKIYLFTRIKNKKKELFFKKRGVKILKLNKMNSAKDFGEIFVKLNTLGFSRLFVETGLNFLNFLLINKFINNLYVFKSPKMLRTNGKNFTRNNLIKKIILKKKIKVNLFGDNLYKVKLK